MEFGVAFICICLLKIKSTGGQYVEVEATHECEQGGSRVRRHYHRRITLPPDVDPNDLQCDIDDLGMLQICAPIRGYMTGPSSSIVRMTITHE